MTTRVDDSLGRRRAEQKPANAGRRARAALVAALLSTSCGGSYSGANDGRSRGPCEAAEEEQSGVWNDAARAAVTAGMTSTPAAYAKRTAGDVVRDLDGTGRKWIEGKKALC